ncbi:type VII secretion protein EccCa [Mycolicibacterium sp.]|uniref:type VII secretion protein EccCa n=1 Tax=Mycolicibacterium sp. TaxID=2320850 RepID=UPI003D13FD54
MDHATVPSGQIAIDAPPELPAAAPAHPLARLLPVAMVAAMVAMSVLYLSSGNPAARSPMFLFLPAMMLVSVIGTLAYGGRGAGRGADIDRLRAQYLRYLDTVDALLAEAADRQHQALHRNHPDPAVLWTLAGTDRMWERGTEHPLFGAVRIGVGEAPAGTVAVAPELAADDDADPVTTDAVRRLLCSRSVVAGVPVAVPLSPGVYVTVTGETESARAAARAMVCQLAALHHPDLLSVALSAGPDSAPDWDWLKWLPHHGVPGGGARRVLIVDGGHAPGPDGQTVVIEVRPAAEPGAVSVSVAVAGAEVAAECDRLSRPEALACARRIAGVPAAGAARRAPTAADWPALTGIDDPEELDPDRRWAARSGPNLLRVPVGVAEDGTVVDIDIKEAAAGGMGPHGLCVGATGSGKSEFLRTLVLGLIATHSPEVLNLVLVDFKGGATFLGLDRAQHVSAVITNLADEAPLVARMREALSGEVHRRQQLLRAAGNLTNTAEYGRARARDRSLAPLPALFIVVDEFSELLSQQPDFAELFVAIGRLGRSLGMHLLLASQRLDEGRLRGLETHLSYRICLKTFSASESRAVLGVPDAYHLPAQPGAAYLKTASGAITRLQTAYVSGRYTRARRPAEPSETATVQYFSRTAVAQRPADDTTPGRGALWDTVLDRLAGHGPAAHRVWLPPLADAPILEQLLTATAAAHLRAPIGLVDCPFEQRREPRLVDVSGAAGNIAVVGATGSGKSTAVRTVLSALAATHDAAAIQFYCLDFGGGTLSTLGDLPQVGTVAGRHQPDLCRRTVATLESLLRQRETTFRRYGVDSWAHYRRLRAAADPAVAGDPYGDVFLVIDGWAVVRQDFDALEPAITALAGQGLSYGIHVMITAARWAELRPALKDQLGTRIELRLGDPAESEMDRRRARELADRPPGRGLTRTGHEMAIARPEFDRARLPRHGQAPPVELLPDRVTHTAIRARIPARPGRIVLGLGEREVAPIAVDLATHPHLLVLGDGECGKTAVLRLLCTEIVRTLSPAQARLEIVDFRRTMLGVVETDHLIGYSVSAPALVSRMAALTEVLTARLPDETVTQRQLRDRSWWHGPDLYVVVDDYDLVAGATGNPLTPLADFLPHAKDLGLHVVVARRSGGAARAMFDPLLARLRDMGCSGLMMSATPDEGVLLGASRPTPLPAGRGTLSVRGSAEELVQVAWVPP